VRDQTGLTSLPLELAIRIVLDDVIYTNCLPDWADPISIDYSAREQRLQDRVRKYQLGANPPRPSVLEVPKRSGQKREWILPAVNDQIILQACVSSFAAALEAKSLNSSVFSYHTNQEPDRVGLTDDQIGSWINFQEETRKRCAGSGCLLQFDLQEAFRSIDRPRLYSFLSDVCEPEILSLFKKLLESFSPAHGLPLLNDTIFFVGNAYLSEVDRVVQRHAPEFIRFVDDYRVFGATIENLETVFGRISADLEHLGFTINLNKVHVGTAEEFLDLVGPSQDASLENDYIHPVLIRGLVASKGLSKAIVLTANDPDRYLNEGYGRLQLGKLRRLRFVELVAAMQGLESRTRRELADTLVADVGFMSRYAQLLETYCKDPAEAWRAVWLIYLAHDLAAGDPEVNQHINRLKSLIKGAQGDARTHGVVRLWAKHLSVSDKKVDIEKLHDFSYFDSGMIYWGEA
jgi:hypothetical protein